MEVRPPLFSFLLLEDRQRIEYFSTSVNSLVEQGKKTFLSIQIALRDAFLETSSFPPLSCQTRNGCICWVLMRMSSLDNDFLLWFVQINTLGQRIDRIFNDQQVVLRAFETDTAKALSTADSRSRAFVDELRSQIFQTKAQENTENDRADQRVVQKLDEVKRSLEKYVSLFSMICDIGIFSLRLRNDLTNVSKMPCNYLNARLPHLLIIIVERCLVCRARKK